MHPVYLVGGPVRDILLGLAPKDLDLVCRDARAFAGAVAAGRNAALVPMEKKPDEPCYRIIDRDHPDTFLDIAEMRGEDINEDLAQRDFTINAIAMEIGKDGLSGEIIDPLHGTGDIEKRTIRLAGSHSLEADPLRIIRGFRLASSLGFDIEPATLSAMQSSREGLRNVSPERVLSEIMLIAKTSDSIRCLRMMDRAGVLAVIFPETVPMRGCEQNGYHHLDVWEHSLLVTENVEMILNDLPGYFGAQCGEVEVNLSAGRKELLKLAALLHDAGKPSTMGKHEKTGRMTFYGHDREGAGIAGNIAERLRMSNLQRVFITRMIEGHLGPIFLASPKASRGARMRWFRRMRDDAVPALILGMADVMGSRGPSSGEEYRAEFITSAVELVLSYFASVKPKIEAPLLINGDDIISMGMKPGIALGKALSRLRFAQDMGTITTRKEALEAASEMVRKLTGEGTQEA